MLTLREHRHRIFAGLLVSAIVTAIATTAPGQAQAPAAPAPSSTASPATRLIGTVTATSADSLTLKLEAGGEVIVQITPQTRLVRTAPGEKTLAGATSIHVEDLATGDRVLVRATATSDATHPTAAAVIAMKQADIAQAHASQSEDWQRRGVSGAVQSVTMDPSAPGTATIVVGTGQAGRTLSIQVTPATTLRRYAADSINFADARPSTLDAIHTGDQLRARGDRSGEGRATVAAVEIVSGSFRNIAGTVTAIDPAQNTLTLTDLATKKPVTLHLTAETQMRKLPLAMAERLTGHEGQGAGGASEEHGPGARSTAGQVASGPGTPGNTPGGTAAGHPYPGGGSSAMRPMDGAAMPGGGPGSGPDTAEGRAPRDPATMLQRAPVVTLAELKKGDALMIVASEGANTTAITLIAGVEPLLQGSSSAGASQNLFSASWNLNGSGGAETAP